MPASTKAKTSSVKLDPVLSDKLASLAVLKRRAPHYLMRDAISQYVDRETMRQTAIEDAKKSWEKYQNTGRHITLDEFDAWVDRLDIDPTASIPTCHE